MCQDSDTRVIYDNIAIEPYNNCRMIWLHIFPFRHESFLGTPGNAIHYCILYYAGVFIRAGSVITSTRVLVRRTRKGRALKPRPSTILCGVVCFKISTRWRSLWTTSSTLSSPHMPETTRWANLYFFYEYKRHVARSFLYLISRKCALRGDAYEYLLTLQLRTLTFVRNLDSFHGDVLKLPTFLVPHMPIKYQEWVWEKERRTFFGPLRNLTRQHPCYWNYLED